ncbi:MAG: ABC transporter substrate-binding protein [Patescibacteria group bacterium]
MKKTLWIVGIIIVLLIIVAAASRSPKEASGEPIKIGVIAPLTGPAAIFGNSLVKGIALAQEDLGGTRNVYEVIIEDDGTNPAQSASAAQKLITIDKVQALITTTSGTGNAVKSLAYEAKIPHFCVCNDTRVGDGEYNFTYLSLPQDEVHDWIVEAKKRNVRTVAILSQAHPGIDALITALKMEVDTDPDIEMVYEERFDATLRDFKTIIAKSKIANPDIYFLVSFPPSLEIIGQELKNAGVSNISSAAGFGMSANPSIFEGYWYTDSVIASPSFITRFEKAFPEVRFNVRTAPQGYDTFMMLVNGFEEGEDVSNYVKKITEYDGMVGKATKEVGGAIFSISSDLWVIKNGKAALLE